MSYSDSIATAALVITVLTAVFAYVAIPSRQRAQGWIILWWGGVAAGTFFCFWKAAEFQLEPGAPSRREIAMLSLYMILSFCGWMAMSLTFWHSIAKRIGRRSQP